jgi:hypothetical protein
VTGGVFPVVTGGVSPTREFVKVPPTYFQIVVGKGESDKGDLVGRTEAQTAQYGPTALVLRDRVRSSLFAALPIFLVHGNYLSQEAYLGPHAEEFPK